MFLPAVKITNYVTLEKHALSAYRVATGSASDCAGAGLRYLSVYVR